jgi:hypothetical protein
MNGGGLLPVGIRQSALGQNPIPAVQPIGENHPAIKVAMLVGRFIVGLIAESRLPNPQKTITACILANAGRG